MIVFADTSGFIALMVGDDDMHTQAATNFTYFMENAVHMLTSSYVLTETIALLQRRIGMNAVWDFQTKIFPILDIIWIDAAWHQRGMQRLLSTDRKKVSLTDCLSFEIMQTRNIGVAFSFDRHFSERGFSLAAY